MRSEGLFKEPKKRRKKVLYNFRNYSNKSDRVFLF